MHQGHRVQQVTQVHKSPEGVVGCDQSDYWAIKEPDLNRNQYQCLDGDEPADQTEPGEAVVEGIASGQSVVTVLHSTAGELCSTVVHFSHQVQPLPAGGSVTGAKKLTKGRHIFSVCADAWIKTGYRDRAGIKCIIADKKPPHLSFSRVQ